MVKSMFAAVAGLKAHQQKMDVIGNNIANANTFGYKKARVSFADQFYSTLSQANDAGDSFGGGNPQQVGYGSQIGSIDVNFGTGGIASTDVGMDAMILGQGFFLVGEKNTGGILTANQEDIKSLTMTRVGSFNTDGEGNLVVNGTNKYVYGYKAITDPATGAVTYDKTKLEMLTVPDALNADGTPVAPPEKAQLSNIGIADDGTVSGIDGTTKKTVVLGKIAIANVPNPNALEAQGFGEYRAGANTGKVTAEVPGEGSTGILGSGRLEMSNVDLAQEFTDMITTQRGYQANTRIITVTDEMLQELVNIKR